MLLTEARVNYFDSPFALYMDKDQVILYDVSSYPTDCVAAFLKVRHDATNVPAANQVAQTARAEKYPGAGEAIYKIASSAFHKPITSDRTISTSPSAQQMWQKIASDPSFQKQELDNWIWNSDNETKTYVSNINKANNTFQVSSQPKTVSTADDAVLPGKPVDKENPNPGVKDAVSILGTPNAYNVSIDLSKLLQNNKQAIESGKILPAVLINQAKQLWNTRY